MSQPRRAVMAAITAVALVGLVGCSSSKKSSTPSTTTPTSAAAVTSAAADTSAAASAAAGGTPAMTLSKSTGLTEGESITVTASGFPPGDSLGINECALVKGTVDASGGSCDLASLQAVTADSSGNVAATMRKVTKGPFGALKVTCSTETPCLLSVSELVPGNPKAASAPITFG